MSLIRKGAMTWESYSQHRESVKEKQGYYMGLLDEWLEPICDISLPVIDYSAPVSDWIPVEFSGSFSVPQNSHNDPVLEELVYKDINGKIGVEGGHKPEERYIIVEPRGGGRMTYRVEFVTASGSSSPEVLEVHGLSPEGFILDELPYVNQTAYDAMVIYKNQNPLLWRSSLEIDMGFQGLPLYNSNTLALEKEEEQSESVYDILNRSFEFIIALINRDPAQPHLVAVKDDNVNDSVEVRQEFETLASVIRDASLDNGVTLNISLSLPGDNDSVTGNDSVSSPCFFFKVGGRSE